MKTLPFILSIGLLLGGCDQSGSSPQPYDEAQIRKRTEEYVSAFNMRSLDKMAEIWSEDATYVHPVTGDFAEGREEIRKYFKERFADGKNNILKVTILNVEFPENDYAVETGQFQIIRDGELSLDSTFRAEFSKENGNWYLEKVKEIELQKPSVENEHLKELSWLIGDWTDEDDNVSIEFSNEWDENKTFIIQYFTMKIYDQDDLKGEQIIGWDPAQKQIRSWIFDSDGGFGEGKWNKEDENWNVDVAYTLTDGSKASATYIYTPQGKNSYSFSAVNRELDGELLPNLDPVKVIRD